MCLGMLLRHLKSAFLWLFALIKGVSTNPTLQMTQTKTYFLLKLSNFSGLKFYKITLVHCFSTFCVLYRWSQSLRGPKERDPSSSSSLTGNRRLWLLALVLTYNPLRPESWALGSFEKHWCLFL